MAQHDLIFRGASVIDGSGRPRFVADLAVAGDRIAAVGDLGGDGAPAEVDAAGLVLAPGFIDVHTHDDRALCDTPDMSMKVSQGVTTVVAGNCGISLAPLTLTDWPPAPLDMLGDQAGYRFGEFADYTAFLGREPPATNAALLVGHMTLRQRHMTATGRGASDAEIARMRADIAAAMAAGAVGFSAGLDYPLGSAAPTAEVTALVEAAAAAGGLFACHTRNYFAGVEEALEEAFTIAGDAGAQLVISHHQVTGRANHGRSLATLARIEQVAQGLDLMLDAYPYTAGSKSLDPQRCQPGVKVVVTWSEPHPDCAGQEIAEIARRWGLDPIAAAERLLPAGAVYFQLDEGDVRHILAHPLTMIGSDGLPFDRHPHPRLWGTFPRVLGHYARDVGLFDLETAVHKMTGQSAATFGLAGRGLLQPGAFADLVLFDPATVGDRATYEAPKQAAAGIRLVLVNGRPVWRDGQATGERPGRVLRRAALPRPRPAAAPAF